MKFPALKGGLSRVGFLVPPKAIHFANGILNYLSVGRWFYDRRLKVPIRCAGREPLYDYVAGFAKEPVSYLEFGVFKGVTLGYWTKLLKHQDSFLHGFDSFEGLPETWGLFVDKEVLNVGGVMPKFDDPRVRLFKGWFSDTLPKYLPEFRPHDSLVVHLDADLYSSTIFVLRQMRPFLRPGTILIFDEFFDREHELKAFTEFLNEEKFAVECLAATCSLTQAAFRITNAGNPSPTQEVQRVRA
jgi:hypothetical protein